MDFNESGSDIYELAKTEVPKIVRMVKGWFIQYLEHLSDYVNAEFKSKKNLKIRIKLSSERSSSDFEEADEPSSSDHELEESDYRE